MSRIEDIKRELVKYGLKAVERKLVVGTSGNISARIGDGRLPHFSYQENKMKI